MRNQSAQAQALDTTHAIGLALAAGPERWTAMQAQLANPIYIWFHVLCLISVAFVAVRFFSLFPKAQPPKIGPAKPPPGPVILAGLYGAWIGVTVAVIANGSAGAAAPAPPPAIVCQPRSSAASSGMATEMSMNLSLNSAPNFRSCRS